MAGPWNASLAAAMKFSDFTASASTVPTSTNATAIWAAESAIIEGELLGRGITISASGKDNLAAAQVEAMMTSAAVQEAAEKKANGSVSQDTMELRKRGSALLARYLANPAIMEALGASVSRKRIHSMPVDYPNVNRDSSTYKAPLMAEAGYGVDEDM